MLTRPRVMVELFWYRNPFGPVMLIENLPMAVPWAFERSHTSKVAVYPGFRFTAPSASKATHFGPVVWTLCTPVLLTNFRCADVSVYEIRLRSVCDRFRWKWNERSCSSSP